MKKIIYFFLAVVLNILSIAGFYIWKNFRGAGPAFLPAKINIEQVNYQEKTSLPLEIPKGFSISIYAKDLVAPRVLEWDPIGNLLVSIPSNGKVVAIVDQGQKPAKTVAMIDGLNKPHGIVSYCYNVPQEDAKITKEWCTLLVAEENKIRKFTYEKEDWQNFVSESANKDESFASADEMELMMTLPSGGRHITRTLLFKPTHFDYEEVPGTTGRLFISIGSSCDVCHEADSERATIMVADIDFLRGPKALNMVVGKPKIYAKGLRNSVFMATNPRTRELWATEMGRDLLGDDLPPDEINIIKENKNYGWPVCYGKNIHDTVFDKNTYFRNPCLEPFETPSYIDIPAHSAPLGLAFFPNNNWGEDNNLLVAYHGSWNRSTPTGYKVVLMQFDDQGKYLGVKDFITGWIAKDRKSALGRPVGLLFGADGDLYISDDKAGVIYKVIAN